MSEWFEGMLRGGKAIPPRQQKEQKILEIMKAAREVGEENKEAFWADLLQKMRDEENQLETKEIQMMHLLNDDVGGYWETCFGIDKLFQTSVMKQILFLANSEKEKSECPEVFHWVATSLLAQVSQPEWRTLVVDFFEEKTKLGDDLARTIQTQTVDPKLSSYSMQFLVWLCAWRNFSVKSKEQKMKAQIEPVD